jgi:REP-associated tyrosine transposase
VTRQVQVSAGGVRGLGYQMAGCPKYRRPVLVGRVEGRGEELIGAVASGHGWRLVALGIMSDHVHLFVKAHRSDLPSRIADPFKGSIWRRLQAGFAHLRSRLPAGWSRRCFAPTAVVAAQTVRRYVGTQNELLSRKERAR